MRENESTVNESRWYVWARAHDEPVAIGDDSGFKFVFILSTLFMSDWLFVYANREIAESADLAIATIVSISLKPKINTSKSKSEVCLLPLRRCVLRCY